MKQVHGLCKFFLVCFFLLSPHLLVAAEGEEADLDNEQPSYQSAAQAGHAANLAEAASSTTDAEALETATSLEAARKAYDAVELGTPEAEEALADLEQARLAYAEAIANTTGTLAADIYSMRMEEKMGWGQIAHELGVHPSVIGLGHPKKGYGGLDPVEGETFTHANAGVAPGQLTQRNKDFTKGSFAGSKAHGGKGLGNKGQQNKAGHGAQGHSGGNSGGHGNGGGNSGGNGGGKK